MAKWQYCKRCSYAGGKNYCHKQESMWFAIYMIIGKSKSLNSTEGHIGKFETIDSAMELENQQKLFCRSIYTLIRLLAV